MTELIPSPELDEADRLDFLSRRYSVGVMQLLLLHSGNIVLFDRLHNPVALIIEPGTDLHSILIPTLTAHEAELAKQKDGRRAYDIDLEDDGDITINL